jgi:hypothetical protein
MQSTTGAEIMTSEVTVGMLVTSVLMIAGDSALKGFVGEATKDAYKALKNKVAQWAQNDLEKLETNPTKGREVVVAEAIDSQTQEAREEVEQMARDLLELLEKLKGEECSATQAIGYDFDIFRTRVADLTGMRVVNGIGLRAKIFEADQFIARDSHIGNDTKKY